MHSYYQAGELSGRFKGFSYNIPARRELIPPSSKKFPATIPVYFAIRFLCQRQIMPTLQAVAARMII